MFEVFITNLGRYVEGHLDGEYLKLPATTEQVQALLKRIPNILSGMFKQATAARMTR